MIGRCVGPVIVEGEPGWEGSAWGGGLRITPHPPRVRNAPQVLGIALDA